MANIVNIAEYRARKQREADMDKLTEMRETIATHGVGETVDGRMEFMMEMSRLSMIEGLG